MQTPRKILKTETLKNFIKNKNPSCRLLLMLHTKLRGRARSSESRRETRGFGPGLSAVPLQLRARSCPGEAGKPLSPVERPGEQRHQLRSAAGGEEWGAGLSACTSASAAGRAPHRSDLGLIAGLAVISCHSA